MKHLREYTQTNLEKDKNGITLIALIITIVVMLILAGITINLTMNGELLEKANVATERYNMEAIKEQAETIVSETKIQSVNNEDYLWEKIIIAINERFENSTKNGNLITTSDEKYDIRVNSDYSIEVTKHGEMEDTYIPEGVVTDYKAWTVGNYPNTILWFSGNIDKTKLREYTVSFTSEEEMFSVIKNSLGDPYDKFNTYLEYMIYSINIDVLENTTYSTLEEILQDENINKKGITTKEQLIAYYYHTIYGYDDETKEEKSMTLNECMKREYLYCLEDNTKEIGDIKVEILTAEGKKEIKDVQTYYYNNIYLFEIESGLLISKNGKYYFTVKIDDRVCGKYEYEVTTIKYPKLIDKVSVGDYVAYNAGAIDKDTGKLYNISSLGRTWTTNSSIKWRVLEKTDSNVKLISENTIYSDDGKETEFNVDSETTYTNLLDRVCSIYGHGVGAQNARSILKNEANPSGYGNILKDILFNDASTSESRSYLTSYAYKWDADKVLGGENLWKISYGRIENGTYKEELAFAKTSSGWIPNVEYKTQYYKIVGGIRPIVILESELTTTGKNENGVWQLN